LGDVLDSTFIGLRTSLTQLNTDLIACRIVETACHAQRKAVHIIIAASALVASCGCSEREISLSENLIIISGGSPNPR